MSFLKSEQNLTENEIVVESLGTSDHNVFSAVVEVEVNKLIQLVPAFLTVNQKAMIHY